MYRLTVGSSLVRKGEGMTSGWMSKLIWMCGVEFASRFGRTMVKLLLIVVALLVLYLVQICLLFMQWACSSGRQFVQMFPAFIPLQGWQLPSSLHWEQSEAGLQSVTGLLPSYSLVAVQSFGSCVIVTVASFEFFTFQGSMTKGSKDLYKRVRKESSQKLVKKVWKKTSKELARKYKKKIAMTWLECFQKCSKEVRESMEEK